MSSSSGANGPAKWPVLVQGVALFGVFGLGYLGVQRPGAIIPAIGYALGAIVIVAFASVYRALKSKRRGQHFRENPRLDKLVMVLTVAGLLGGLFCAYLLANEVAKW